VVYIDRVEGLARYPIRSRIGIRFPATTTAVGKVLLAYGSEEVVQAALRHLVRRTERSITQPDAFRACLAEVRERGFAADFEENETGIRCAAAPVRDHRGHVGAAVSVTWPAALLGEAEAEALTAALVAAADEVSAARGSGEARQRVAPA
jgi:IclR family transcriptional regulator, acetate operon repressor